MLRKLRGNNTSNTSNIPEITPADYAEPVIQAALEKVDLHTAVKEVLHQQLHSLPRQIIDNIPRDTVNNLMIQLLREELHPQIKKISGVIIQEINDHIDQRKTALRDQMMKDMERDIVAEVTDTIANRSIVVHNRLDQDISVGSAKGDHITITSKNSGRIKICESDHLIFNAEYTYKSASLVLKSDPKHLSRVVEVGCEVIGCDGWYLKPTIRYM